MVDLEVRVELVFGLIVDSYAESGIEDELCWKLVKAGRFH